MSFIVQVEANYTYIFNVCGTVGTSAMPDKCKTLTNVGQASALQINTRGTYDQNDDYCFLAGEYSEVMTKVSLLNQEDPTKGIQVSYAGGRCTNGDQRMFNIEMACMDKLNPVATHALEYSHCVYTVTMPSIYGCPLECPVSNRHLCGGNGHCAYDDDKHAARCFCNNGKFLLLFLRLFLFQPLDSFRLGCKEITTNHLPIFYQCCVFVTPITQVIPERTARRPPQTTR